MRFLKTMVSTLAIAGGMVLMGPVDTAYAGACEDDADCNNPNFPRCNVATGQCVECLFGGDCDNPTPFCYVPTNECVECLISGHCDDPTPFCDLATRECVECLVNNHCDQSDVCNGIQTCEDGNCQPGIDPCPFQQCQENQGQPECVCTNFPSFLIIMEPSQTVVVPGQNVTVEVFLEASSCVDVNAYAIGLDCFPEVDIGLIEVVDPDGQMCTGHAADPVCAGLCVGSVPCFTFIKDFCGPGIICIEDSDAPGSFNGFCENSGICLAAPIVDQTRSDFIFDDAIEVFSVPDDNCAGDAKVNVNAVNMNPGITRVLPVEADGPQYLGSFVYHVSDDAAGGFRVCPCGKEGCDVTLVLESFDSWSEVIFCPEVFIEPCIGVDDDTPCDNAVFCDGPDACVDDVCTPLGEVPCEPNQVCDEEENECIPFPPNDQCDQAERVQLGETVQGTTTGATLDGVPFCDVIQTSGGVWYSITGTGNTMTASTCNQADFNTQISIYCGDCLKGDGGTSDCCFGNGTPGCDDPDCQATVCGLDAFCCDIEWDFICGDLALDVCEICSGGDLTCVAGQDDSPGCDDFTTELSWCSEPGAEYLILVHGFFDETGDFSLTLSDDDQECVGAVACLPECITDAVCDDGRFCNGEERCLDETCVPAGTGVSNGGFQGSADWTSNLLLGEGSISFLDELTVVGANGGAPGAVWASQVGVELSGVNLEFDLLSYTSNDIDENLDYPVFFLDGIFYGLNADGTVGDAGVSGSINNANQIINVHFEVDVEALAGSGQHTIGFGVNTVDGLFGPGTAVFDSVFPEAGASFPCPALGGCDEAADTCIPLDINMSLVANDLNPTEGDNILVEVFVESNGPVHVSQFLAELPCTATGGLAGGIVAEPNIEGSACTGDANDAVCPGDNFCLGTQGCFTANPELDCGPGGICVPDPDAGGGFNGFCENAGLCGPAPFTDETRSDYIFADAIPTDRVVDDECAGDDIVKVASVNTIPGTSLLPPGQAKYLGRFLYNVLTDTAGEFQLDLLNNSRLFDVDGFALPLTTKSLTLEVGCETNADCDNGDFCDGAETCEQETGMCQPGTPPCAPNHCDQQEEVCIPFPFNDECVRAEAVQIGETVDGTTTGATADATPLSCGDCGVFCTLFSQGVWYSVTGTGNTMTASTCGQADFDTQIGVFCGDCLDGESDCCVGHDTPGCDDSDCEDAVCAFDPFCCDNVWNPLCAHQAEGVCGICSSDLTCVDAVDNTPGCPDFTTQLSWCSEEGVEYLILVRGLFVTGDFSLTVSDDGSDCVGAVQCLPDCTTDAVCSDGRFCNGEERCVAEVCVPAGTGVSNGGFQGPEHWASNLLFGEGSISFFDELTVVGANDGTPGPVWASQDGVDLSGVNLEFDLLSYTSNDIDKNSDYPVFVLDGIFYGLNADGTVGDAGVSGSINNANQIINVHFEVDVEALAGSGQHTIGFGVNTVDGLFGPGTAVFDNVFPEAGAVFPCPGLGGCDELANQCVPLNVSMSLVANDLTPTEGDNVLVEVFIASNGPVNVSQFLAEMPCAATGGVTGGIFAVTNIGGSECTGDAKDAVCPGFCLDTVPCFTANPALTCGPGINCVADPNAPGNFNGFCENAGICGEGQCTAPDDVPFPCSISCENTVPCFTSNPGLNCAPNVFCVFNPTAPDSFDGFCQNAGNCRAAPFIDESRSDYIFAGAIATDPIIDGNCAGDDTVNVASVTLAPGSSVLPHGQTKYLGRFLYHVFAGAVGEPQIDLLSSSRLFDAEGFALPFSLQGLTFSIACTSDSQCNDFLFCTGEESCVSGHCRSGIPPCQPGDCNEPTNQCACEADEDCDNGDFCDGDETCSPVTELCQPGTPPCPPNLCDEQSNTCDDCGSDGECDDGKECTDDSCGAAGTCEHTNNTNACDDGDACTEDDECTAGVCAGTAIDCGDDGNECTDDVCTDGVCQSTDNTADCDDGDACTVNDECTAGACTGTAIDCDDGLFCTGVETCVAGVCVAGDDPCLDEICDEENAECVECLDGAGCDDDDACTTDSCDSTGSCVHDDVDCDDADACTDDSCDAADGCVHAPMACDDNDSCTTDTCEDGACLFAAVNCDDGDACTDDTCEAGNCLNAVKDCDDGNVCTDDSCSATTGVCVNALNVAGCDDNNPCTENDSCINGDCVGSAIAGCILCVLKEQCPGDLDCTDGVCQPAQAAPCTVDQDCLEGESCTGGACRVGCEADEDCGEGQNCVNSFCYGACTADTDCDDGVWCNGPEACTDNACTAGDPACLEGEDCDEAEQLCTEPEDPCGVGMGCTMQSPGMALTLFALLGLRTWSRKRRR